MAKSQPSKVLDGDLLPLGEQTTAPVPKPAVAPKGKAVSVQRLPTAAAADPQPKNLLAVILAVATNPSVEPAKVREYLVMQRELEEREEARVFNDAMLAAQSAMPRVVRDKWNEHTKAHYPTLENVSKSIDPVARQNGFTMSWGTADSPLKDHYRIVCDLAHTGGCVRRYHVDLQADTVGPKGTKNKTEIQGVASSISFGRRILKILMFDLVIVGDDRDGNKRGAAGPKTIEHGDDEVLITKEQLKTIIAAVGWCGVGEKAFCEHYKIEKIPDLPARFYDDAMKACEKHAAKQGKKKGE